jgi:hypothetical protein
MSMWCKRILVWCAVLVAGAAVAAPAGPPAFSMVGSATCQRGVAIDAEVSGGEGTGTVTFTVRSSGCTPAARVAYRVDPGTAGAADIGLGAGALEWAAGDGGSRTVSVAITSDRLREADVEDFTVTLSDPTPGTQLTSASGRGRVLDDDGPDLVWVLDPVVCPPCVCDWAQENVNCPPLGLTSSATPAPSTVYWSTVDGSARAGIDFVGVTNAPFTVPAGVNRFALPLRLLPRPTGTPPRSLSVRLVAVATGHIADATAVVTIEGP